MAKQKTTAKRAGAKRARAPVVAPKRGGGAPRVKPARPSAKQAARKPAPKAQPPARKAPAKQAAAQPVSPKPAAVPKPTLTPVPPPGARPNTLVPQRAAVAPVVRPTAQPALPRPVTRPQTSPPAMQQRRSEKSPSEMAVYAGMTEADLLQMSPDDYMNDRQLAYFREMLVTMKQQLLENADVTSEHLRENDIVPDPADRATIEEEHTLELRTRDRERKLMRKIDESIARISDGSYGWCEETGDAIGLQRLLARPTATLSVEAQARRELKQKLYGE
jgi:RNA polymerase-binding transcription factor